MVGRLIAGIALVTVILVQSVGMAATVDTAGIQGQRVVFVDQGKATSKVYYLGEVWTQGEGYIEGVGKAKSNDIFSTDIIAGGDFYMRAKMSIPINVNEKGEGSAATFSFDMNNNRIGFAGIASPWQIFVGANANGEIIKTGTELLGKTLADFGLGDVKHIETPFLFEVVRKGNIMSFYINGQEAYSVEHNGSQPVGKIGFHPWRGTIRLYEWEFTGQILNIDLF